MVGSRKSKKPDASKASSPTALSSKTTSENEEESATGSASAEETVTKQFFQQQLKKLEQSLNKGLNDTIEKLESTIKSLSQSLSNTEKQCEKLSTENKELKSEISKLKMNSSSQQSKINAIEERIEDRTNRQLRKTLVLRGIAEDKENETWDETKDRVAFQKKTLYKNDAYELLERVHRAAPNPHYKGNAPRPIFAAIYSWPDAEKLVELFRKANIEKTTTISCDYKYGPLTTKRRSLAYKERKKLKEEGTIISGYVAFPARLMVKTSMGAKYHCQKDFSKEKVMFGEK